MATTGYADVFGRTVANGLGTATSGQVYTLSGTATQYSVGSNTGNIAITASGDNLGYVDLQTSDADLSGRVAISGIPASNSCQAGFVAKLSNTQNYYVGTMYVATGGAVSVRIAKRVANVLTILTTVATGITYVANTYYNLRFSVVWSSALNTNVISVKIWAVGATEPGGWTAQLTDNSLTQYTAGTNVGIIGRDESSVISTLTTKYQAIASRSYSLPVPATTDPMCYDPAIAYPKQTALESLADAADAALSALDDEAALAGLFPRVRISNTGWAFTGGQLATFAATEFNVGTPTNLGYDSQALMLPVGIWAVTFELQLREANSDYILVFYGDDAFSGSLFYDMRSNTTQNNNQFVGGTAHISKSVVVTDPTTPKRVSVNLSPNSGSTAYTAQYMALSAIKISDYFA